jgi:hypothetical protein
MRKMLNRNKLNALLAGALVASLAAFGCTTNTVPGEGQPWLGGPGPGPSAPTSGTPGTSVPTTPPPMTSSYTGADEQGIVITTRSRSLPLSPDQAAAVVSGLQSPRVRVLGPVNPGAGNRPYASDAQLSRYENMATGPQYTVNNSIRSQELDAITSGVTTGDDAGAAIFPEPLSVTTPTTISAGVPPTTAASIAPSSGTTSGTATGGTTIGVSTTPTTAASQTDGAVRVVTANGRVTVTNTKSQ